MELTISATGTRFAVGRVIRRASKNDSYGIITDVKLTRVSFGVWHLQFKTKYKG